MDNQRKSYISNLEERCKKANFAPYDDRFPNSNKEDFWDDHTIVIAEIWLYTNTNNQNK